MESQFTRYLTGSNLISAIIILFTVAFVYNRKATVFYLKYYSFIISYSLFGLISLPILLLNPGSPSNIRIGGFFSRKCQAPFYGIRTRIKGLRNYPEGPFIIVCNHQSALDNMAMMEVFPENCVIIMKKSIKYSGPFGLCAMLVGTIFVDRGKNNNSRETFEEAVKIIQEKGRRVWFFPEGTRISNQDQTEEPMLPFKKGAFNMAVLAQVPIVPIVFSSQESFFSLKEHRFNPGEIVATILPPVPTTNLTLEDVPRLTEDVRAMMMDVFLQKSE